MTITVFLLDDHEMVRRGLRDILATEDDIDVIGEAGTVDEGARGIVGMRPDVALVDVVLPDGNGVEVCEALRTYAPDVRTLVLTSFCDDDTLFAAIDAGAAGVQSGNGFGPPCRAAEISVLSGLCRGRCAIKAAGGIHQPELALDLLEAGAALLGTSSAPELLQALRRPIA